MIDIPSQLAPLFAKLLEHPVIQDAIAQGMELRNNIIKTAVRFDARFDSIETKLDKLVAAMPGEAGDDGLLKLLESANVQPCDVPDCTNTAVHDHGAGPVQRIVLPPSKGSVCTHLIFEGDIRCQWCGRLKSEILAEECPIRKASIGEHNSEQLQICRVKQAEVVNAGNNSSGDANAGSGGN